MSAPNVFDPDFDEPREHAGFDTRRARIGRQVETERLGASVFEIPPGQAAYPYHFHLAEEELLILLRGTLALRTPAGWGEMGEGEVFSFRVGEAGAHQVLNQGEVPALLLAISTQSGPDVVIYADSNKLGAFERRPEGGGLYEVYRREDAVGYWERESPPEPPGASG